MILYVSNNEMELELGKVQMSLQEFVDMRNHPYIATNDFEYAVIDLDSCIPAGYLKAVATKIRVIPKIVSEEISNKVIMLLSELYPERGAELRFTYLREKEKIGDVIASIREQFEWDKFYM